MKKLFLLLVFYLFSCKSINSDSKVLESEKKSNPIEITYKVNQESVASILKYLSSDELEGRETGEKGMEKAADYLIDFFQKNNIKPYFNTFRDTLNNFGKPAYNIVGYLEGTDSTLKNEFVIFSAHYDHIGIDKNTPNNDKINNGANDDASGVTAVAEITKYFSETKSNKRSVLFVFFVGEEKGLLGSKHLAQKLKKENFNLYTLLNFEMIGVPMKRDYSAYVTGFELSNMAAKVNEYTSRNSLGFLAKAGEYKLFYRSDNFSFFNVFGAPCQSISTFDFENFDYYHNVADEFELMNIPHMTNLIQELLPAVTQMTTTKTHEIKML